MSASTENKSYFDQTISALSPWSSKSSTPKPRSEGEGGGSIGVAAQRGGDHVVNHRHRLSIKQYPPDCPKSDVQWFYAVDVAKRKPNYGVVESKSDKPASAPKKWQAFSTKDSKAIEIAYQKLAEGDDKSEQVKDTEEHGTGEVDDMANEQRSDSKPSRTVGNSSKNNTPATKVPVNEDYLFDVDVGARELGPAYWLGPVYEVRRGSWFFVEGSTIRPCDENLAMQLEEGYLKTRPWKSATAQRELPRSKAASGSAEDFSHRGEHRGKEVHEHETSSEKGSAASAIIATVAKPDNINEKTSTVPLRAMTYRLFGTYMNSAVTYQDDTTAWLVTDDFLSRMSSTVYQRFAGGAHFSGTKVVRGYTDLSKKKAIPSNSKSLAASLKASRNSPERVNTTQKDSKSDLEGRLVHNELDQSQAEDSSFQLGEKAERKPEREDRMRALERQMSNLVSAVLPESRESQDEEARRREEQEIRDDYRDEHGDMQDREIEHLILVTHGIGQRLGARFETFNFIHDVNEFRKTLKSVYNESTDLQALNSQVDTLPKNCRIQVLPVTWRHLLDFPRQSLKHNRKEFDLGDATSEAYDNYPSLNDITVDGVPALRNIVADLALDVLLFQTPAYREHISSIVARECNRIYKLFRERNPTFKGQVSVCGHSLGSAILFDILSSQHTEKPVHGKHLKASQLAPPEIQLNFEVQDFYCFGSPIGLFQMLNGKTVGARVNPNKVTLDGTTDIDDTFHDSIYSRSPMRQPPDVNTGAIMSKPKCQQLFNIFHPTDPISYRLEPLISPAMTSLPPQPLPYTKRSLLGAPMGQGLTGIPARVGQSFSGLWSSFSSGLVSSAINRSLGLSSEDAARLSAPSPAAKQSQFMQSVGAGTNIVGGGVIPAEHLSEKARVAVSGRDENERRLANTNLESQEKGQHPPTRIESKMETLYAGYQKRRKSWQNNDANLRDFGESAAWNVPEEEGRRLKREEAKVRALNSNGRVDYSIQEGAFDISFLASIASHLGYWTDEDVCHFVTSQLLSRQRLVRRTQSARQLRS